MKCIITGANGQVGDAVSKLLGSQDKYDLLCLSRNDLDISNRNDVNNIVSAFAPDVIVNAAAMTNVDLCESEIDKAFAINALGVRNLKHAASRIKAQLIHISTDYVFDGESDRPYTEYDLTNPLSIYAKSKLGGDVEASSYDLSTVLRVSWVFGNPKGDYFSWALNGIKEGSIKALVHDQIGTPTYSDDIAQVVSYCITNRLLGLINVANKGETTKLEMAQTMCKMLGMDADIAPITEKELNRAATRPDYSALSSSLLFSQTGIEMRHWEDALQSHLKKFK